MLGHLSAGNPLIPFVEKIVLFTAREYLGGCENGVSHTMILVGIPCGMGASREDRG